MHVRPSSVLTLECGSICKNHLFVQYKIITKTVRGLIYIFGCFFQVLHKSKFFSFFYFFLFSISELRSHTKINRHGQAKYIYIVYLVDCNYTLYPRKTIISLVKYDCGQNKRFLRVDYSIQLYN